MYNKCYEKIECGNTKCIKCCIDCKMFCKDRCSFLDFERYKNGFKDCELIIK